MLLSQFIIVHNIIDDSGSITGQRYDSRERQEKLHSEELIINLGLRVIRFQFVYSILVYW